MTQQQQQQRPKLNLSQVHKSLTYRTAQLFTPKMEWKHTNDQSINNVPNHTNETITLKVGGLGLASSAHNRISLDTLSNTPHKLGKFGSSQSLLLSSNDKMPKAPGKTETVTAVWPTGDAVKSDLKDVNMHVMGQPIDPRVVNHLHPDVSPFKARKLRKILAGSLDREWTSETAPRILRQRGISGSVRHGVDGYTMQPDHKLINEAHALNFTFRHEMGNYFTLPETQLKAFRNWLIDKATCEMDYIWEDLGPLFWPRWIRRGVCINPPGHSCSWPPGMKCRPSGSRALQLLHWKCEDAAYIQSRKRAAEQRNRRRTATNTFHSNFYDMKPVNPVSDDRIEQALVSRLSLQETHSPISLAAHSNTRTRLHTRSLDWDTVARGTEDEVDAHGTPSKDERRKRRARRLIKRLSVNANGYHCYWQVQKYLISDRCACLCS